MEPLEPRHIGDVLKDRNIVLIGADSATAKGFTQVPNFLLKSRHLSAGDKLAYAMLLSYAWQKDSCFPGQETLAKDLGLSDRSVRTHLKSLERRGLLNIRRRGQGRTNIYELSLRPRDISPTPDRKKTSGQDRQRTSAQGRKKTSDPSI